MLLLLIFFVFFFKQKTAYEIRKGDWSSDVCSSDLAVRDRGAGDAALLGLVLADAAGVTDVGGAGGTVAAVRGRRAQHAAGDGGVRARAGVAGVGGAGVAVVAVRGRRARHAAGDGRVRAGAGIAGVGGAGVAVAAVGGGDAGDTAGDGVVRAGAGIARVGGTGVAVVAVGGGGAGDAAGDGVVRAATLRVAAVDRAGVAVIAAGRRAGLAAGGSAARLGSVARVTVVAERRPALVDLAVAVIVHAVAHFRVCALDVQHGAAGRRHGVNGGRGRHVRVVTVDAAGPRVTHHLNGQGGAGEQARHLHLERVRLRFRCRHARVIREDPDHDVAQVGREGTVVDDDTLGGSDPVVVHGDGELDRGGHVHRDLIGPDRH